MESKERVLIYWTSTTPFQKIKDAQKRIFNTLSSRGIPYDLLDAAATDQDTKNAILRKNGNERKLPQIFVDGEFRGLHEAFDEAVEYDELDIFLASKKTEEEEEITEDMEKEIEALVKEFDDGNKQKSEPTAVKTESSEKSAAAEVEQPEKPATEQAKQPEETATEEAGQPEKTATEETKQPEKTVTEKVEPSEKPATEESEPSEKPATEEAKQPEKPVTEEAEPSEKPATAEVDQLADQLAEKADITEPSKESASEDATGEKDS